MSRELVTIGPDAAMADAVATMARHRIRRLPVVSRGAAGPKLIGIVSTHDVLHAFPPDINPFAVIGPVETVQTPTVSEFMTRRVLTIKQDAPLEDAARR